MKCALICCIGLMVVCPGVHAQDEPHKEAHDRLMKCMGPCGDMAKKVPDAEVAKCNMACFAQYDNDPGVKQEKAEVDKREKEWQANKDKIEQAWRARGDVCMKHCLHEYAERHGYHSTDEQGNKVIYGFQAPECSNKCHEPYPHLPPEPAVEKMMKEVCRHLKQMKKESEMRGDDTSDNEKALRESCSF